MIAMFMYSFLGAIITYRLSRLIAIDDLPFDVGKKFRIYLYQKSLAKNTETYLAQEFNMLDAQRKLTEYNEVWTVGNDYRLHKMSSFYKGLICPHCNGMWVALILAILWNFAGIRDVFVWYDTLVIWGLIAGIQSFLVSIHGGFE